MNTFYFHCKACGKSLKQHSKKTKDNEIKEDDLCSHCRKVALDSWIPSSCYILDNEDQLEDWDE